MRLPLATLWTGPVQAAKSGLRVSVDGHEHTLLYEDDTKGYWWARRDNTLCTLQVGAEEDSEALALQPLYQIVVEQDFDRVTASCVLTNDVVCEFRARFYVTLGDVRSKINEALGCPNGAMLFNNNNRILSPLEDHRSLRNLLCLSQFSIIKDRHRIELYDEHGSLYWHSQM